MENKKLNPGKVDQLISFLGMGKAHIFGVHEASRKLVYHERNFSAFLEGRDEDIRPVSAELVPSIKCNFNCPSCTYSQNGSKKLAKLGFVRSFDDGLMNQETLDSVILGLKNLGTKSVIVTGGGEPSMHFRYLEYLRNLKYAGLDFALYTNAGILSGDEKRILELEPTFVRMSLNSGDSETHARMYGTKGAFEDVVNNIIKIGKAKKETQAHKTALGIGFILGPRNSSDDQLEAIANTLRRIDSETKGGIDYAAFRPEVQYFVKNLSGKIEICNIQPSAAIFREMPARIEEKIKHSMRDSGLKILVGKDGFEHLSKPYKDGRNIAAPWSISINYDGQPHLASEGNGDPDYCFSSRPGEKLEVSWNGALKKDIAERMASLPSENGHISIFPHYKLMTTNNLLLEIRDKFGKFTPEETKEFYSKIDISKTPEHVNFI